MGYGRRDGGIPSDPFELLGDLTPWNLVAKTKGDHPGDCLTERPDIRSGLSDFNKYLEGLTFRFVDGQIEITGVSLDFVGTTGKRFGSGLFAVFHDLISSELLG